MIPEVQGAFLQKKKERTLVNILEEEILSQPETHLLLWFQRSKELFLQKRKKERMLVNIFKEEILSKT